MNSMSEELVGTSAFCGTEDSGLTVECAWNIGKAVAEWFSMPDAVAVMYTPSHEHMGKAVIEGLRLQGRTAVDGGNGDRDAAKSYIRTAKLAGAIVVDFNPATGIISIEVYQQDGKLVDMASGLRQIHALVEAGNFVPAAQKGELTHIA